MKTKVATNAPLAISKKQQFDIDLEEMQPKISKEMVSLFIQDVMNRQNGVVEPDTTGADYFFIQEFITEAMSWDFGIIEQDFLNHCSGKMKEFGEQSILGFTEYRLHEPSEVLKKKVLEKIYNGAKLKDSYCCELLKNLYKLYHKKEYNQLKRFSKISVDEVLSIAGEEFDAPSYGAIGRILGICPIMHIEFEESCSFLFLMLNKRYDDWIECDEAETEYLEFPDGLFDECLEQVQKWNSALDERNPVKEYKEYWEDDEFLGNVFRNQGFVENYELICAENYRGLALQFARTLAVLKLTFPKREFTFEDVQHYTHVYTLATSMVNIVEEYDNQTSYLLGEQIDHFEIEDSLYKPGNIQSGTTQVKKPETTVLKTVAPVKAGDNKQEDYLAEIESLRARLREKEQENRHLREQMHTAKATYDEQEVLLKKYQGERDELIALRDFAYRQDTDLPPIKEETLEQMKEAIAARDIVIVGGHTNWINKLKSMFPKWLYASADSYKTIDGPMLDNKEKVYFFTNHISHSNYNKFIAAVRERNMPFGYLANVNLESLIRQIYEEME